MATLLWRKNGVDMEVLWLVGPNEASGPSDPRQTRQTGMTTGEKFPAPLTGSNIRGCRNDLEIYIVAASVEARHPFHCSSIKAYRACLQDTKQRVTSL